MHSNFYPITIPFDEFQIQRTAYSEEKLKALRRNHNTTHSFFRCDEHIYISRNGEIEIEEGEITTLSVAENPKVIRSLLKHIFFRSFKDRFPEIIPLDFYPFRFLSRQDSHDLVKKLIPDELHSKIGFKKQTDVQFRDFVIDEQRVFVAVINQSFRWVFNVNCKELYRQRFNLQELDVIHSEHLPGMKGVIAPDESLVGRFIKGNGNTAVIETNDGEVEYPLEELFINKTASNIEKYLSFKLGEKKAKEIFSKLRSEDEKRYNAQSLKKQLDLTANLLSKINYQNADGFSFNIVADSFVPRNSFSLQNSTYIFDYTGTKTSNSADKGLSQYGPWDSTTFEIKKPKILVICHRSNRGAFSSFLGRLKTGISNSRWFARGFVDKYKLHDVEFVWQEIDSYEIESYLNATSQAFREHADNPISLTIVETKEQFKRYATEVSPYYHIKASSMALGIPVQFVKAENTREGNYGTDALLNGICLQIYAKLGGTPWVIPANQNIDRELIIGIGSSISRSNKYVRAEQARIVGITTFFSSDGRYLLGDRSRDVAYADYFDELLNSLRSSINLLSDRDGWQTDDTVRIVFHIFKPLKNIEIDVVNQLVSEFKDFQIRFAFVTISDAHPLILFDEKQKGIQSGRRVKGSFVPIRSSNSILDEYSCLLQLKGPREIKTVRQGISRPVLIRIHPDSTFLDLNYIVQQIYTFTTLSWRSFLPSQIPVSLYYSDLIARLLSQLRKIDGWNPNVISTSQLKFKKWFL